MKSFFVFLSIALVSIGIESAYAQIINDNKPASDLAYKRAIVAQFYDCWTPPFNKEIKPDMKVTLVVTVEKDGKVSNVYQKPNKQYANDDFYKVFSTSAVRAIYKCSPLKKLPPVENYSSWHKMKITFSPHSLDKE